MKILSLVSLFILFFLSPDAGYAMTRNGIGAEKIKAVQEHVANSQNQLNTISSLKTRKEADAPFERLVSRLDAASGLVTEMKAEVEKNMAAQSSESAMTQKYVDLQSDLVELATELARLKRHSLAASKEDTLDEVNGKVKYLQKGFSELDTFLKEIEKEILSIQ